MHDYLIKFTEKVIIATRSGETEKEKIINELASLLNDKPDSAQKEMIQYLEFLSSVAKGEDTETLWNELPQNLKDIFGEVMQKFKGADIFKDLEEITKKAIVASKSQDEDKILVLNELEAILSQKPDDGSASVVKYLEFLIDFVRGNDVQKLIQKQDKKLMEIFNGEMEKLVRPDMMKFFTQLTEMAFRSAESEEARASTVLKLNELISSKPPEEIKKYLDLLLAVTEGTYTEDMKEGIPQEILKIFNGIQSGQ